MALVSASVLREYLPEIGNSTGADTELNSLIARVEAFIARYLGFPPPSASNDTTQLDQATYTLYIDAPSANDETVLYLTVKPIISLTSVHSDLNRKYTSDTALTLSNIDIDSVNGKLIIKPTTSTNFKTGYRANKVVCVAGYSSSPPPDLVHAICVLASQIHRQKQTQGKETINVQGASVSLSPKTIPDEVKQILYRFKNPSLVL